MSRPRPRHRQPSSISMAALQEQAKAVTQAYQSFQTEIQKLVTTRTQLGSQVNENEMVLEELTRLKEDANVFKMIGPALIKQDLVEAKANVNKRIDYIKGEIGRTDSQIKSLESKCKEKENEVQMDHACCHA